MKKKIGKISALVILGMLLGMSLFVVAPVGAAGGQDIDVSPTSINMGDVVIGSSTTAIITITNVGIDDLTLTSIFLGDTQNAHYFEITLAPPTFTVLSPSSTADVEVTFAPEADGKFAVTLMVGSDDPDEDLVEVPLSGNGVVTEPTPGEEIAQILDFYNESVQDGTLTGDGQGGSADGRLGALENMLEAAGDLIEEGAIERACEQLRSAYKRTDGISPPPDFVTGDAAADLASHILALLDELGCT